MSLNATHRDQPLPATNSLYRSSCKSIPMVFLRVVDIPEDSLAVLIGSTTEYLLIGLVRYELTTTEAQQTKPASESATKAASAAFREA